MSGAGPDQLEGSRSRSETRRSVRSSSGSSREITRRRTPSKWVSIASASADSPAPVSSASTACRPGWEMAPHQALRLQPDDQLGHPAPGDEQPVRQVLHPAPAARLDPQLVQRVELADRQAPLVPELGVEDGQHARLELEQATPGQQFVFGQVRNAALLRPGMSGWPPPMPLPQRNGQPAADRRQRAASYQGRCGQQLIDW